MLLKHNMLSEEEVQQVAVYRGFKPFLLQVWAMQTIRDYLDSGADKAAGAGIGPFQAQALALRANCSDVVNLLAQPVPFPYYHVVSFMLCVNLFGMACAAAQLWRNSARNSLRAILCAQFSARSSLTPNPFAIRYALIGFNSVMTIPVFFVVCLVLLGMKETAVMLSDPFGGDAVDFDCDQARATRRPPAEARPHPTYDHRHIMPALTHVSLTPPLPAASATSSWRRSSTTPARSSRAAPTSSRRSSPSPPCSSTRRAATTARDDVLSGRAAVGWQQHKPRPTT